MKVWRKIVKVWRKVVKAWRKTVKVWRKIVKAWRKTVKVWRKIVKAWRKTVKSQKANSLPLSRLHHNREKSNQECGVQTIAGHNNMRCAPKKQQSPVHAIAVSTC